MKTRIFLALSTIIMASCSQQEPTQPANITLDMQDVILMPESTANSPASITFNADADWKITTEGGQDASNWLRVWPESGRAGKATLYIEADENTSALERMRYVQIESAGAKQTIRILQRGDGTLPQGQSIYQTGGARDTIILKLRAGRKYQVDVNQGDEWLTPVYLSQGERFDSLALILSGNTTLSERTASVRITETESGYKSAITVLQPSAALDIDLSLMQIQLPSGTVSGEQATQWVDRLFVAAFDQSGNLLFSQDIPKETDGIPSHIQVTPQEDLLRNVYPSAKVYIVANSSRKLTDFHGTEQDFLNRKDTASLRLFDADSTRPPLSGVVVTDLKIGQNQLHINLSHVTARVIFKVISDTTANAQAAVIDKLRIGGFSSWGYLFSTSTDGEVSPRSTSYYSSILPNSSNQYQFFAFEGSQLILTVRTGGRYYQGIAPNILKRGYKYTFNMRVAGSKSTSSNAAPQRSTAPGEVEQTIDLIPL